MLPPMKWVIPEPWQRERGCLWQTGIPVCCSSANGGLQQHIFISNSFSITCQREPLESAMEVGVTPVTLFSITMGLCRCILCQRDRTLHTHTKTNSHIIEIQSAMWMCVFAHMGKKEKEEKALEHNSFLKWM